jgi:hypothetical protein
MKSMPRITRQLLPFFLVLVVSSIMFLPSVNGASPTINTGSFIANTLHIQTGETFNGFQQNSDWTLSTGTGVRTYRTVVEFDSPFQVPPKVSLALRGQDVEATANNRLLLTAENITVDGFELVYQTWLETLIYSVWTSWTAIGLKP